MYNDEVLFKARRTKTKKKRKRRTTRAARREINWLFHRWNVQRSAENDSAFVVLIVAIIMVETERKREREEVSEWRSEGEKEGGERSERKRRNVCAQEKENDVLNISTGNYILPECRGYYQSDAHFAYKNDVKRYYDRVTRQTNR